MTWEKIPPDLGVWFREIEVGYTAVRLDHGGQWSQTWVEDRD